MVKMEFASTGVSGLDEVLGGQGFRRHHVHFVQGPSGSGKTTLALQFLMEGARLGERSLYIGTSESEEEIEQVAHSHGWSLKGIRIRRHTPEALVSGEPGQTIFHPAELELPKTMGAIMKIVEEEAPQRLAIDSLAEIRVMAHETDWYRRQLTVLEAELLRIQCTTLLTDILHPDSAILKSLVTSSVSLDISTPSYGPDRQRLRVEKTRAHKSVPGYHDYRIITGGLQVFPRLVAAEYRSRFGKETASTGLKSFDAQLGGGITRGTSTLVLGPAGTGKSILVTQCLVAAAERGEHGVMYVFDERIQTLFQRAQGVGLELEQQVRNGLIEIRQIDPAEVTPGELGEIIRRQVADRQIRMLVIDSLSGYQHAMPDERFLAVHLHEMSSYLSQQAVSSLFTLAQHGYPAVDHAPLEISYVADNVIQLSYFDRDGSTLKAVKVVKRRCGPHETSTREFIISGRGLAVGDTKLRLGNNWNRTSDPDFEIEQIQRG